MKNSKTVYILSSLALAATTIVFIVLLFMPLSGRFLFVIPFWLFAFIMGTSKGLSNTQIRNFADPLFIVVFLITSFADFFYEYNYDKKDWQVTTGYIYEKQSSRHASSTIYYRFDIDGKFINDEKGSDIFTYVGKGYRLKDSIYVVYSASNPLVNDIYKWEDGPTVGERDNIFLYFVKYNYYLKWTLILTILYLLLRYFGNQNREYYPIDKK